MILSERRLFAALVGLGLGGALFGLGCGQHGPGAKSASDHPLMGAMAPALDLPNADGSGRVSLADHAGKVVVVDFWATWCEPCRESFPVYQKLIGELGGELVVIGVSVDEDPAGVPAFMKQTGATFPVGWDDGQGAAHVYAPPKMPTSFVLDRGGVVRFVHEGFRGGDEAQLREELRSLL